MRFVANKEVLTLRKPVNIPGIFKEYLYKLDSHEGNSPHYPNQTKNDFLKKAKTLLLGFYKNGRKIKVQKLKRKP